MIKIIKQGNSIKKETYIKTYQITCKICNTIFECFEDDLNFEVTGHGESDKYIQCPNCFEKLYLRSNFFCNYNIVYHKIVL